MKWNRTRQTENEGVLYVQGVVNDHGSIFRPVHQESDVGIDGFIELVDVGEASGQLVAVQIKSGDSYLAAVGRGFRVSADEAHLRYWRTYMVPVILVCYSPTKRIAAWQSVRDFIEHEEYRGRNTITAIEVPKYSPFNVESLGKGIAGLAHARADERLLIKCADKCLSHDSQERRDAFAILSSHPDSRGLRITAKLAREFLLDADIETAKKALFILGYAVGRRRWSWNPQNEQEQEIIRYSVDLCSELSDSEIRRLVDLVDGEEFSGPHGLGERGYDVLCCCYDRAQSILDSVACDRTADVGRRASALYLLYDCSDEALLGASESLSEDPCMEQVLQYMYGDTEAILKLSAYSEASRPAVPREGDRLFRGKATTDSRLKPTTWPAFVGKVVGLDWNRWSLYCGAT